MNLYPNFDKQWNYQNPMDTRLAFEKIKNGIEASTGAEKDTNYITELTTQIARTYSLEGKFAEAHQVLDGIEETVKESSPRVQVRFRLERGRAFNSAGDAEKAKPIFQAAYSTAKWNQLDYYAADAAHMVSLAAADFKEKVQWTEKGIEIAKASTDRRAQGWLGPLHNNLGWDYYDKGEFEPALKHFQEALKAHSEHSDEMKVFWARLAVLATQRKLRKFELTIAELEVLRNDIRTSKTEGLISGYVAEEIAECLYALERKEESKKYFNEAYTILSKDSWLIKNEKDRLERLKKLGQ